MICLLQINPSLVGLVVAIIESELIAPTLGNFKQRMNVNLNFSTSTLAGYGIDHVA